MKKVKIALIVIGILVLLSGLADAGKVKYIDTDYRFNYVKLVQLKPKEAATLNATHPYSIDENALTEGLKSLIVNRRHMVKDGVTELEIFNDPAISFLSRNIAKALLEATPSDEIWFSYLVKSPIIIIRNDRLTAGQAWMASDGLHIKFSLLKAPVFGDTNKRGYESKIVKKKQGVRLSLGYAECQSAGSSSDELVLDMNCFAEKIKSTPAIEPVATSKQKTKIKEKEVVVENAVPEKTTEERLQELEDLKEKKLISNKEYKSLRKEILKDLKK